MIERAINTLHNYIQKSDYKGYDPYDTLNARIPFKKYYGCYISALATQFQKYNPVNIRRLVGITKGINPKGMGLLLKAYTMLNELDSELYPISYAEFIFDWLKQNTSKQYELPSWGYNFDWASPHEYVVANTPSSVVTAFVIDGIWEYYKLTKAPQARDLIIGAGDWISQFIPVSEFDTGISFAYTPISKGACYNASLLACEVLARADWVSGTNKYGNDINKAIDYVISNQKNNGAWWYSYDPLLKSERKQIDFHQGFILVSLNNLMKLLPQQRRDVESAITKGIDYYRKYQFYANGRSLWRIPKVWPVDIHNQSQGIITFSELSRYNPDYIVFANTIAEWTIRNMQDAQGFFYYRKFKHYTNMIPYMRWSQAWMLLALASLKSYK